MESPQVTFGILMKLKRKDPSAREIRPILQVLDISQISDSVYLLVVSDQETTVFAKLHISPAVYKETDIWRNSLIELVEFEPCWADNNSKFTLIIKKLIIPSSEKKINKNMDSTTVDMECVLSDSEMLVDNNSTSVSNGTDMTIDSDFFDKYFDD